MRACINIQINEEYKTIYKWMMCIDIPMNDVYKRIYVWHIWMYGCIFVWCMMHMNVQMCEK